MANYNYLKISASLMEAELFDLRYLAAQGRQLRVDTFRCLTTKTKINSHYLAAQGFQLRDDIFRCLTTNHYTYLLLRQNIIDIKKGICSII